MWELIAGLTIGIIGATLKDVFIKGRTQARLENVEKQMAIQTEIVDQLKKETHNLENYTKLHQEMIMSIREDHEKIDSSVDALNDNIAQNNQAIASLDATLKGVQQLLQNIFEGNLKITTR